MVESVKQAPLLVISSPQKGDKVRFGSQVGKIIAFSEDKTRVQVDYVAFDGPAKKWVNVDEVRGLYEPVATPSDTEPKAEPLPEIKEWLPKYKAGDVVVTVDEQVLFLLEAERDLVEGEYACENIYATGRGTVLETAIVRKCAVAESLALLAQYAKAKEKRAIKPRYTAGDVVVLLSGLVKEVLGDADSEDDAPDKLCVRGLMNGSTGTIPVTAIMAKLPTSAALGMKRLSAMYLNNLADYKRIDFIRTQQEVALKDAVKKMSEMSKATLTPPAKNVVAVDEIAVKPSAALKQIKVLEIGADGLTIPDGWELREVKSVFDGIHERMTHYAVIVQ